jgi:hypothetical protein
MHQIVEAVGELSAANVLHRLEMKGSGFEGEIDYAASHFYELDLEDLKLLDFSIVEGIVSSPFLRLESEDSLLEFILGLDCERTVLFRYLHSDHLSSGGIAALLKHHQPAEIDPLIWSSLCRRLVLPLEQQRRDNERKNACSWKGDT